MALPKSYLQTVSRLPAFFEQLRGAQAPDIFSQQILKDWGYTSSNDRTFIPILKNLGFLSSDGKPTQRYSEYRDYTSSKRVMGDALKEAYSDIFLIKEYPTDSDRELVKGKFKSYHNASDNAANLMTNTFFALLDLAELKPASQSEKIKDEPQLTAKVDSPSNNKSSAIPVVNGLHYNIQIHLPPTTDIEVYNAIFKSLKEHIFES